MAMWRAVLAALALAGGVGSTGPAFAQLKVVVTSKPIHSLVAGVMAGTGSAPRLLIEGNASPHTYALKPSDAKALNEADVVFRVSEGLEPFTVRVFRSLPKSVRAVTLEDTPGLVLLDKRAGGPFEAHSHGHGHKGHSHGHGDKKDGHVDDPHVWLDPANARQMVAHIASTLAAAAPAEVAKFQANAADLAKRLDALDVELARDLKPAAGKPFVMFHDSLQYLEARYGLAAAGTITVSPDEKPSAKRLADLRKKISGLSAVCVFREPQFPDKLVGSVTEGTKARTAVVDPEGGLIEPGPDLYFQLMRKTAEALKGCLAGGGS